MLFRTVLNVKNSRNYLKRKLYRKVLCGFTVTIPPLFPTNKSKVVRSQHPKLCKNLENKSITNCTFRETQV